jgi:hypothetical protein
MPRCKPLGWPRYMVARRLKSGTISYYWVPPSWAKGNGCPFECEVLGTDYGIAKKRCDELLNLQFDAWRKRGVVNLPSDRPTTGTFDWMISAQCASDAPGHGKGLKRERKAEICRNVLPKFCRNTKRKPAECLILWWAHKDSNLGPAD